MGYMEHQSSWRLVGVVGPRDIGDQEVRVWTNWNGDLHTTKSTGGLFIELRPKQSGHSSPIVGNILLRTSTGTSSAETDTVSLLSGLRQEALLVQELLECLL